MFDESKIVTRIKHIDKQLIDAGWKIMDYQEVKEISLLNGIAVEVFPINNGPADYALIVKGKVFGAIEEKRFLWRRSIFWNRQNAIHGVPQCWRGSGGRGGRR